MNYYYLGPNGSYSHIVATYLKKEGDTIVAQNRFEDIVHAVVKDKESCGLLAIENSITSSVHQTVDLLYSNAISIVGEISMQLTMCLLGLPDSDISKIKVVYSHRQALAQCSHFIKTHGFDVVECSSTAEAASVVSKKSDDSCAAIGSGNLAKIHNLNVLMEDIADSPYNMTRWVLVSHPEAKRQNATINKLSYIFKVKHEPGSLVAVLTQIAQYGGNLTKIESRPIPGSHWEYGFWIDVEIPENSHESFDSMMKLATLESRRVGAYTKGILI